MYSFLPDEILKEILSPALQVPDQSFASINDTSPFAKYERSTSAYLLVCKDWLRVATPLLYNVVILRSKAQIQTLALALKSTPILGNFIKKLRIECGYDSSLSRVFQAAKNLTDLCLSLEIYSQENVSGICKGITLVQPHRVILYDPTKHARPFNQKVIQLAEALIKVIPTWTNLMSFVLPSWRNKNLDLSTRLKRALCNSPSLQEIRCSDEDSPFIPEFAKIPTIKRILICGATGYSRFAGTFRHLSEVPEIVRKRPELAKLVAFDWNDERDNLLLWETPDPSATLSSGLPSDWFQKCPTSVLENILFHAMGIPVLQGTGHGPIRRAGEDAYWHDRWHLGLVCKRFREFVRNLDRQYVIIHRQGDLHRLAQQYRVQPELGNLARSLFVHAVYGHSDDTDDLAFVLSCCPNLCQVRYINSNWFASYLNFRFGWREFSTLASCSGHKLFDLQTSLHEPNSFHDPVVFCNFTNLRHLCWDSHVTLNLNYPELSKTAFYNLETLACVTQDETFLGLMVLLDLPRIHSARFPKFQECPGISLFLKRHGPKLRYLQTAIPLDINIFETCPNLKIFSVPDDYFGVLRSTTYPTATAISCSWNHLLEEVHLETTVGDRILKSFFGFLGNLDLSSFPRLRCIKISECTWPSTEHEIRKSCWVPWAERLKNLYGVDVINSLGKTWVPRLKVKGRRR